MDKYAFLLMVVKKLEDAGSWTGNTHVQKTVELIQSVTGIEKYRYLIHHYGPYSFELRDDLDILVGSGFVDRMTDDSGYHYKLTEKGLRFLENSDIEDKIEDATDKVVEITGKAPTLVLELISTIDYILNKLGSENEERLVATVKALKPHFSEDTIRRALEFWQKERAQIMGKT